MYVWVCIPCMVCVYTYVYTCEYIPVYTWGKPEEDVGISSIAL